MSETKTSFLALAPHAWGAGETHEKARRNLRKAGHRERGHFVVVELRPAQEEFEVCSMYGPKLPEGVAVRVVEDKRDKRSRELHPSPWPKHPVLTD